MTIFIGLMSGTSMDGVDGVALRWRDAGSTNPSFELLATSSLLMPQDLRERLFALQRAGDNELVSMQLTGNSLAQLYATCVKALLARANLATTEITAIGAHGQTVRHQPHLGFTVQLLNASLLAEITGIPVAYDFRSRDIAAGGQGAPLVPAFHAGIFRHATFQRAIVNIGGIANVSMIPSFASNAPVIGFDCGPGNALMDAWCEQHTGARFDDAGAWGASGTASEALVKALTNHPFFSQPAPKSTGRDDFHLVWLGQALSTFSTPLKAQDVQASLLELTVHGIAIACEAYAAQEVFVCGGGASNLELMRRLANKLKKLPLKPSLASTEVIGMSPQWVEAAAFAWFAKQRVEQRPGNLIEVTGAGGLRILGSLTSR